jgi:hypothetical protein
MDSNKGIKRQKLGHVEPRALEPATPAKGLGEAAGQGSASQLTNTVGPIKELEIPTPVLAAATVRLGPSQQQQGAGIARSIEFVGLSHSALRALEHEILDDGALQRCLLDYSLRSAIKSLNEAPPRANKEVSSTHWLSFCRCCKRRV